VVAAAAKTAVSAYPVKRLVLIVVHLLLSVHRR
jgi:hypothetical protein